MEIQGRELQHRYTTQASAANHSATQQGGHSEQPEDVRNRHHEIPASTRQNIPPEKLAMVEMRLPHRYIFHRPRALQYRYQTKVLQAGDRPLAGHRSLQHAESNESNESNGDHHEADVRELLAKSRERLDLFIDLVWVGIIGNLSEIYSSKAFQSDDARPGTAILLFALAFLPSWRIWNGIREFLNNYHQDDMPQRAFIFWLLALSVFFGNNIAYLPEDLESAKVYSISTYLVIRGSLLIAETFNSIFILWLRKTVLLGLVLSLPSIGLWIYAIYASGDTAIGPVLGAIVIDYLGPLIMDSPLAQKSVGSEYGKALDPHHFTSRMGSFFIITLGEGVLQLIKGGPLGLGLRETTGLSVWTLVIYFLLAYLYSNKDYSRTYVPAVVHRGWRSQLWISLHIPIFMSLLTLSASLMFIIDDVAGTEDLSREERISYVQSAIWTVGSSLGFVLASMTGLALLDESLDPPGTLRINNRYVRLSGRAVYIIIVILVPIKPDLSPVLYLGICSLLLWALGTWEYCVSIEKGFKVVEPKGLTAMLRNEHSHPEDSIGNSLLLSQLRRGEKPRTEEHRSGRP